MIIILKKLNSIFDKSVEISLVSNIVLIIILALVSIISRWLHLTNLWIDPLNRHLVLLLIFLGATIAIEKKKHLKVDALTITLENKIDFKLQNIIDIFFVFLAAVVVFFLFYSGVQFWKNEFEYPVDAFLGLYQYHLAFIIPLGFFILFIKYVLNFLILSAEFKIKKLHS